MAEGGGAAALPNWRGQLGMGWNGGGDAGGGEAEPTIDKVSCPIFSQDVSLSFRLARLFGHLLAMLFRRAVLI